MKYTEDQIELFEKMFVVTREYDAYYGLKLNPHGLDEGECDTMNYNSSSAAIFFTNGRRYVIHFGESNDAEGLALDAFNHFIFELNQDEEAFEKYLQENTSFREV